MQAIYDMFTGPGAIIWAASRKVIVMFIWVICLSVAAIAIRRVYFPLRILIPQTGGNVVAALLKIDSSVGLQRLLSTLVGHCANSRLGRGTARSNILGSQVEIADDVARANDGRRQAAHDRIAALSPRQREVIRLAILSRVFEEVGGYDEIVLRRIGHNE